MKLRLGPPSLSRPLAGDAERPQLTSLVDMMTILVVFLLVNFSVQGELASSSNSLRLPDSTSRLHARPVLSIEIGPSEISIDGRPVVALAAVAAGDSLLIAPLAAALREAAAGAPLAHVTLQCDRDLDFGLLKRIIHTCSAGGVADFAVLVQTREEAP